MSKNCCFRGEYSYPWARKRRTMLQMEKEKWDGKRTSRMLLLVCGVHEVDAIRTRRFCGRETSVHGLQGPARFLQLGRFTVQLWSLGDSCFSAAQKPFRQVLYMSDDATCSLAWMNSLSRHLIDRQMLK